MGFSPKMQCRLAARLTRKYDRLYPIYNLKHIISGKSHLRSADRSSSLILSPRWPKNVCQQQCEAEARGKFTYSASVVVPRRDSGNRSRFSALSDSRPLAAGEIPADEPQNWSLSFRILRSKIWNVTRWACAIYTIPLSTSRT